MTGSIRLQYQIAVSDSIKFGRFKISPAVVTKLGSLHSAPAWPRLRLCARPSRENPPAPKPDFRPDKIFIEMAGRLACPRNPTRPDCAHRCARPSQRSIPSAKFRHSAEMQACSCRICNQHRATSPARGSGFKPDTTRTNHARTDVIGFLFIMAATLSGSFSGDFFWCILVC